MQQIEAFFPSEIMGEINSFMSIVSEYNPLGCCMALCSCCGENCLGDDISTHCISPVGLRMQGVEYGIRSCSKLLCLENYEMARRCNYMTREQLTECIGKENFEFYFTDGNTAHLGPIDQADQWQFGVCVRQGEDHRVVFYTVSENQMHYQRVTFYMSELIKWNMV
jgi:hypothetical protein